jgi:phosphate transport system substrate-binding protein
MLDIKTLPIAKVPQVCRLSPAANVLNGTYPVSRQLYWYTAGQPKGSVKALLDWVLGPEGQKMVSESGFYPLRGE